MVPINSIAFKHKKNRKNEAKKNFYPMDYFSPVVTSIFQDRMKKNYRNCKQLTHIQNGDFSVVVAKLRKIGYQIRKIKREKNITHTHSHKLDPQINSKKFVNFQSRIGFLKQHLANSNQKWFDFEINTTAYMEWYETLLSPFLNQD